MKTLLIASLAAVSCLGQSIGKQHTSGSITVLEVSTQDELTLFVTSSRPCEVTSFKATLRVGEGKLVSKAVSQDRCSTLPSKISFKIDPKTVFNIGVEAQGPFEVLGFVPTSK